MTDREPAEVTNLDRYGSPPLPWSRPHDLLVASPAQPGTPYFLGTSRPDGRPHAASVGAQWLDGDLYFTSGPGTRKARNLAANPACTFSVALDGIDLTDDVGHRASPLGVLVAAPRRRRSRLPRASSVASESSRCSQKRRNWSSHASTSWSGAESTA